MSAQARRHISEIPKPTREELRAQLTYDEATDTFYWIRNTAKRVRAMKAGWIRTTTRNQPRMIHVCGFNYRHDVIKEIFLSEENAAT